MPHETHSTNAWPGALALWISLGLIGSSLVAQPPAKASVLPPLTLAQAPLPAVAVPGQGVVHAPPAPVFADFVAWIGKYQAATPESRAQLEPAGVALATARRKVLWHLIYVDPEQALTLAVPLASRNTLPPAITAQLEQRISGRGAYDVLAIDQFDVNGVARSRIKYSVILKGKAYHAGVYGRRLGVTTKNELAVHGIALDNYLALDESPVRRLEPGEAPDPQAPVGNPTKLCPICGADATNGIPVDVGGVLYYFDKDEDVKAFEARIEAQENIIGPTINGLEPLPAK